MKTFRRILFATDFSQASRKAFEEAVDLAAANEAELVIVNAYQLPALFPTEVGVTGAFYNDLDEKLRDNAGKRLQAIAEEARSHGIGVRLLILVGAPFEAIVDAARTMQVDLIVMGTHGRTGASRFFLGSIASRVISTAPCPVMTVRAA